MKSKLTFLMLILVFQSFLLLAQHDVNVSGEIEVHYLNVGQADAILIFCPTKEHKMLIDAGDTRYPGSSNNFKTSVSALIDSGSVIDVVVATHPHADHIGSMQWVLENYSVSRYVDNGQDYGSVRYNNLMDFVFEKTNSGLFEYQPVTVSGNEVVNFCPAENLNAEVIMTGELYDDCRNPNNCSVIIKMTYNKVSFLFPGDAEKEQEAKLLNDRHAKRNLRADVLKAGHHGSATSSTYEFIKAVAPRYIIVSVGEKNTGTNTGYNHPQFEAVNNFNKLLKTRTYRKSEIELYNKADKEWINSKIKARVLFTHIDGTIIVTSDGYKISVRKQN